MTLGEIRMATDCCVNNGGEPRRVSAQKALWLAWSPDGNQLAILVRDDGAKLEQLHTHLFILDASPSDT